MKNQIKKFTKEFEKLGITAVISYSKDSNMYRVFNKNQSTFGYYHFSELKKLLYSLK